MVNASAAYVNSSTTTTVWPQRGPSFYWVMMALSVVDLLLLFWILNPLAKPDSSVRLTAEPSAQYEEVASVSSGDKPSPFGPVYVTKARVAARSAAAR